MRLPPDHRITNPEPPVLGARVNPDLSLTLTPATQAQAVLTFTYGDTDIPIAGIKITMTESDGTVTVLTTDANGQVTLPTTTNTYTLSASLAETGDDPISTIDASWILQNMGEDRTTLTAEHLQAADDKGNGQAEPHQAIAEKGFEELIALDHRQRHLGQRVGEAFGIDPLAAQDG